MKANTEHEKRIKQELKQAGVSGYGLLKGESHKLPSIIHEDEHIGGVVYGMSEGVSTMLVATDKRVIYLDSKPFFTTFDELTYDVVSGIKVTHSVPFTAVVLHTRLGDYALHYVKEKCASIFAKYVEAMRLERNGKSNPSTGNTKETDTLDPAAASFLSSHDTAVISTLSREGTISGAVVHYTVQEAQIYILTKSGTDKGRNVYANHQVAITIFDKEKVQTLQIQGYAEVETDQAIKDTIFSQLTKPRNYGKNVHLPPVTQLHEEGFMVIKITPSTAKFHDYQNS